MKRIIMKRIIIIVGVMTSLGLLGCGNKDQNISTNNMNIQQLQSENKNNSYETEPDDNKDVEDSNDSTMYVYSQADSLKNYTTVDDLLKDSCALVKVKVIQANSKNVRIYIYTSYDMQVMSVVRGTDVEEGEIINVNMPGGIIQGDAAQSIISEVTEGKDAGDLSDVEQIVSDGNTDRLLNVGDEAYMFLIKETDTSFAAVGEYRGEMLVEDENVVFDNNIVGFENGISAYGLDNGKVLESDFLDAVNELVSAIDK